MKHKENHSGFIDRDEDRTQPGIRGNTTQTFALQLVVKSLNLTLCNEVSLFTPTQHEGGEMNSVVESDGQECGRRSCLKHTTISGHGKHKLDY